MHCHRQEKKKGKLHNLPKLVKGEKSFYCQRCMNALQSKFATQKRHKKQKKEEDFILITIWQEIDFTKIKKKKKKTSSFTSALRKYHEDNHMLPEKIFIQEVYYCKKLKLG